MSKKNLIYYNLIAVLLISILYKNLEIKNKEKYIFNFMVSFPMRSNILTLVAPEKALPRQNYLLKLKFVKQLQQEKLIKFNDHILKPYKSKANRVIESDLIFIPREIVKDNNTLNIEFKEKYPPDIDLRLSNSRVLFDCEMVVFFDKGIISKSLKEFIFTAVILSLFFLAFVKVVGVLWRIDSKVIFYSTLISLLPFFGFLLITNSISLFANFKIFISPYFIKFWLPCTFMLLFIIVNFKYLKLKYKKYLKLKYKDKLFIFVFNLLVFLFVFCILEIANRIYIYVHYPNNIFKLSSADLSYVMTPNFKGNFSGTTVTLNSQGMRDREHSFKKEADTYRILCVGDSMVFGFGVNQDEPFPAQLQGILSGNKEKNYEVINTAVPGHNTYQERVYLERVGIKYNPDLVIIGICMNDITGGMAALSMLGTLIDVKGSYYTYEDMPAFSKLQYFLIRHSYFFQYCLLKFRVFFEKCKPKDLDLTNGYSEDSLRYYSGLASPEAKRREGIFKKELLKIKDLTKDIKLLFMIFPNDIQLDNDNLTKPQKMLADFLNENNISYIDFLPIFKKYPKRELFVDIGHPSKFGHKLVAEEIFSYLKDDKLIK